MKKNFLFSDATSFEDAVKNNKLNDDYHCSDNNPKEGKSGINFNLIFFVLLFWIFFSFTINESRELVVFILLVVVIYHSKIITWLMLKKFQFCLKFRFIFYLIIIENHKAKFFNIKLARSMFTALVFHWRTPYDVKPLTRITFVQ